MSYRSSLTLVAASVLSALAPLGCEESPTTTTTAPTTRPAPTTTAATTPEATVIPASLFLAAAPEGAKPLEEVKATAKPGETVTLRGRVGGGESPFVDGRAVMTIVGPGLSACSDNPGDSCKTPWDYCCESAEDIAAHSATVQLTDKDGALLPAGLKDQHGLKELSEVIVHGTVAQAEGGVLVVNASGIYVVN